MDHPRNVTYCDFRDFANGFRTYYSFLSVFVCIFGSITNVLNICVLTSKTMRCPTNLILTGSAVADLMVMLEYIPFVSIFNHNRNYWFHFTYNLAVFVLFHALFTQAVHFISCCLTVILAIWRYIALKFPQNNEKWCGQKKTRLTIFLTCLLCPVICTPLYFSLKITETHVAVNASGIINRKFLPNITTNATIYITAGSGNFVKLISFYTYGVLIKLVPCILLTVLSCLLIMQLWEAKERRQNLMNASGVQGNKRKRCAEKEKQADRTTRMLLAVLLLFLVAEFPQAIFGLLNHIIGKTFEMECYHPLGDFLDVLTLTHSAVSFVLYCIMSKKFREVFKELFFPYIPFYKASKYNWTSLQTLKSYV